MSSVACANQVGSLVIGLGVSTRLGEDVRKVLLEDRPGRGEPISLTIDLTEPRFEHVVTRGIQNEITAAAGRTRSHCGRKPEAARDSAVYHSPSW